MTVIVRAPVLLLGFIITYEEMKWCDKYLLFVDNMVRGYTRGRLRGGNGGAYSIGATD
jgi:hypothetical protein